MNSRTRPSPTSTTLLVSLTYFPVFLSLLSFYPSLFADHPIYRFFLFLAPFYLAYLSARWYIRLSERSSPLYHPLGCLTQCCVWVFHWAVTFYHAFFGGSYIVLNRSCMLSHLSPTFPCDKVQTYTVKAYLVTIFCVAIMFFQEGLFHSIITPSASDTANLGVYENVRRTYGRGRSVLTGPCSLLTRVKGLIILIKLWYLVDTPRQRKSDTVRVPMKTRSMTM
ncbi:hypothetical protein JVU11DRAFT_5830 [Chiua virens]|nr:hypothetical protein JVU11DRAFT_5830 [Chiua virens]